MRVSSIYISSIPPLPSPLLQTSSPLLHPHGMYKCPTGTIERYARTSQKTNIFHIIELYAYYHNDWLSIWKYSIWVSSIYFFLLTICRVKERNELCCIIIYYCELKLKWKYCFCIKYKKSPIKQLNTYV